MKSREMTYTLDGKTIFRFEFANGIIQETENSDIAEIIRGANRESDEKPAACPIGGATQVNTGSQQDAAKIVEKPMQMPDPQCAPAVRADTVPVKRNADVPDDDKIICQNRLLDGFWIYLWQRLCQ